MKFIKSILYTVLLLITGSCITQFMPETSEDKDVLVVEGMITNQRGINTIKLSRTIPLSTKVSAKPVKGCTVTITDDLNNIYKLSEKTSGTYSTDSAKFKAEVGRIYKLTIRTNNANSTNFTYESLPMELKPVPPIDNLYYERATVNSGTTTKSGCQIYLDTHDSNNSCRFYRWSYSETWEFHLPYIVKNNICWISQNATEINIKNTNLLSEDFVTRYPIKFISTESDRLSVKYSMLVSQFSMNEDEFDYWSKLQEVSEEAGSLYDITPATIRGNVFCIENPGETVLGYFSVSSVTTKRIFVKDFFYGVVDLYTKCASDTINRLRDMPPSSWIIEDGAFFVPPYWVLTYNKGCADCTVRGTNVKPIWWQ